MPGQKFDISDLPYVKLSKSSRWALVELLHGDARDKSYFVAPLAQVLQRGDKAAWRRVVGPQDKVGAAFLDGDRLITLTQKDHPHRAVIARPLGKGKPQTLLAPSEQILMEMAKGNGELVLRSLDSGVSRLTRVPLTGGTPERLALPFDGTVRELEHLRQGRMAGAPGGLDAAGADPAREDWRRAASGRPAAGEQVRHQRPEQRARDGEEP